jgi:hypothetical protein
MTGSEASTSNYRLFTLEEANSLLPRLRPLVGRLQGQATRIRQEVTRVQQETGLAPDDPALPREIEQRRDLAALVADAQDLIDEIQREGAVVNGPEQGLVDFPAMLNGELVFLCWQNPEPRVAHWHRIEDGFAGRRPLLDHDEEDAALDAAAVH